MLVVTPMKVTNPPMNLWWCPLVFTAASIVGATHEYTSECLSHPVQKQIATLISASKDFRIRKRFEEQHQPNLTSGMSIKAGGLGEGGGSCARTTLETGANFFHLCLLKRFCHRLKTLLKPCNPWLHSYQTKVKYSETSIKRTSSGPSQVSA